MSHSAIIVQITTPLDFNYTKFCKDIIQKKLAACMHVFPPTESFYVWDHSFESSTERIIHIKTTKNLYDELVVEIHATHPYDVPEIIIINIDQMDTAYQNWFDHQFQ